MLVVASQLRLSIEPPDEGAPLLSLSVESRCTGAALKELVSRHLAKTPPEEQLLYFRSPTGKVLLDDERLLVEQGVEDGAQVLVRRRFLSGASSAAPEAVARRGRLSYYNTSRSSHLVVPEELRVVSGGEPVLLERRPANTEVQIERFTWANDGHSVKVFIDVAEEPRALRAAGDGRPSRVSLEFPEPYGFRLVVRAPEAAPEAALEAAPEEAPAEAQEGQAASGHRGGSTFVLSVSNLYKELLPGQCKVRMREGERITVSLRKLDAAHAWFTLCKAR